jgi:glycosyltransferase involved in cell wall biosynthesis
MAKKIKILLIISALRHGGAERVITYIASYLNKEKYEITLVLYEKKGEFLAEIPEWVRIYDLQKKNALDLFKMIFRSRRVITDVKPDIVLSFLFYTNIITSIAVLLLRKNFKTILSERSYPPEYLRRIPFGWFKKWLITISYRNADLIVTNSKKTEIALEQKFHVRSEMVKTIYNPIDLKRIIRKSKESITHPFFEKNSKVIISVGRLAEPKKFDRLLRVFASVKKNNDKVFLIVIGEGVLRPDLCELAVKLKVNKSVEFVGFKENPWAWISRADIFVLSSDYEGFPNVLLESMACKTPIVSTDCLSGPGEIITNGENGLLVPTLDEEGMVVAVNALLNDKGLRKKYSDKGFKSIEEFGISKIIPQYESLFVPQFNQ